MPHVRARQLGTCFFDGTGFLLPLPPELQRRSRDGQARDTVRSPDVAFVQAARVPAEGDVLDGWVVIPGFTLAVEALFERVAPSE